MKITIEPIGIVRSDRKEPIDDHWSSIRSTVVLSESLPQESLRGLDEFSHVEILYYFHGVDPSTIITAADHPRENPRWPKVGIFAQRKKARPNLIGSTIVELLKIEDRTLFVKNLDAIDGTPVIDIKPVFREYLPTTGMMQPPWVSELMKDYW
jgi:tRNA-Thr(GGU) m(6)t(6)A37 methyltransferase TsaA